MAAIAAWTCGFICTVTEKNAPARAHGAGERRGVERRVGPHHQRPGAPGGAGGGDRFGGKRRGPAGGVRVAAAQPGGGDHRGGQRRADRRGQRVQPADQQALALDLGMAERRALLLMPVDPLLHRVNVDERQHVRAGQQRCAAGQLRQQQPVHLPQLEHVPPGERAQERAQRGRRPDPAEQRRHRPVPQQVHVVDAVRPRDHPGHQAGHLQVRVHPAPVSDGHVLTGQRGQASPLGQRHHRHQARPRHEIRVIKRRVDLGQLMQQSHLTGAPSDQVMEASATPIVPGQGAPFASTRRTRPLFTRWIEAKPLTCRTWQCAACGALHDRNVNAARNILAAGRADRLNACGGDVRPGPALAVAREAGTQRGAA